MVTFKEQLLAWRRVIFALFLRELQSKFNDKLGLGWAFFQPFLFIFALSYARSLISGSTVHSMPILFFMLIGMLYIQSFLTSLGPVAGAIKKNKPLFAFRQVQPISAVITALVTEFLIKVGALILLILTLYLIDIDIRVDNPLLCIYLFALLWAFSGAVALIFGIAATYLPEIDKIKMFIQRPMFFISCVFFSLQDVPEKYWPYLTWNPMVHFIELTRYSAFTSYGHAGVSIGFVTSVTLILLFFGLALYHITWKKVLAR